jgi:hypothetical protein
MRGLRKIPYNLKSAVHEGEWTVSSSECFTIGEELTVITGQYTDWNCWLLVQENELPSSSP